MSNATKNLTLEEKRQRLLDKQKRIEEQIKQLEEREKNKAYTNLKHSKFVMGGDLFSAGFYLDPGDKIGHQGLISYVNRYGKAMVKYIDEYRAEHGDEGAMAERTGPEQRDIEDYTTSRMDTLRSENDVF